MMLSGSTGPPPRTLAFAAASACSLSPSRSSSQCRVRHRRGAAGIAGTRHRRPREERGPCAVALGDARSAGPACARPDCRRDPWNPLATLELSRALSPAELASGPVLPGWSWSCRPDREQLRTSAVPALLPSDTQLLLLVAAAEPLERQGLVRRAAERLGLGMEAAAPAVGAGLCDAGVSLRFRHPLVRSAVYRAASVEGSAGRARCIGRGNRSGIRVVGADCVAPGSGSNTPDEELAAELERSADRGQALAGLREAQVFLQQATVMTPDPVIRARTCGSRCAGRVARWIFRGRVELARHRDAGLLDELEAPEPISSTLRSPSWSAVSTEVVPLLARRCQTPRACRRRARAAKHTSKRSPQRCLPIDPPWASAGGKVAEAARAAPRPSQPPWPADLLLDSLRPPIHGGLRRRRVTDAPCAGCVPERARCRRRENSPGSGSPA